MNPWWLVLICPACVIFGALCVALAAAAGRRSRMEEHWEEEQNHGQ